MVRRKYEGDDRKGVISRQGEEGGERGQELFVIKEPIKGEKFVVGGSRGGVETYGLRGVMRDSGSLQGLEWYIERV